MSRWMSDARGPSYTAPATKAGVERPMEPGRESMKIYSTRADIALVSPLGRATAGAPA